MKAALFDVLTPSRTIRKSRVGKTTAAGRADLQSRAYRDARTSRGCRGVLKEAIVGCRFRDSSPDDPWRMGDNSPSRFLHRAGWQAHSSRECNRNIQLWKQS